MAAVEEKDELVDAGGESGDEEGSDEIFELDPEVGEGGGGLVLHYQGGEAIPGLRTRAAIVSTNPGLKDFVAQTLEESKPLLFMPCDVEDSTADFRTRAYCMLVHGTLLDGSKASVFVTRIPVYFDVEDAQPEQLRAIIGDRAPGLTISTVRLRPLFGYSEPIEYKRVTTFSHKNRKEAIKAVRDAGLKTANDDRNASAYYRKAAREGHGLPLSGWVVLKNYAPAERSTESEYSLEVPAEGYTALAKGEGGVLAGPFSGSLGRDPTLVVGWDCETHNGRRDGALPSASRAEDTMFMICLTASWKDDATPQEAVCITTTPAASDKRWTTIVCDSEKNLLRAFALCWKALQPDFIIDFNGSGYDWPFLVERAKQHGVLGWMFHKMTITPWRSAPTDAEVYKWNYSFERQIKLSAEENATCCFLKTPGCVPLDMRVCYRRLYPKSENKGPASLKAYLSICGLPGKADMPHTHMWDLYEKALAAANPGEKKVSEENMRHVAHYCVVDALRCQQLLVHHNLISEHREMGVLAFLPVYDVYMFAIGAKVGNLLGRYAHQMGIAVTTFAEDNSGAAQYPGAYVVPPKKGLRPDPDDLRALDAAIAAKDEAGVAKILKVIGRPVTGLDFESLYPSIIKAMNLSPEKLLKSPDLAPPGKNLHHISFRYQGRDVESWTVRHDNKPEEYGLFVRVLEDLSAARGDAKTLLKGPANVRENLSLAFTRSNKDGTSVVDAIQTLRDEAEAESKEIAEALAPGAPPPRISPGATLEEEVAYLKKQKGLAEGRAKTFSGLASFASDEEIRREYDAVCFAWKNANTKQLAIKLIMNSFYGVTGNAQSPFYNLFLAAGVTSSGQVLIKMGEGIVTGEGFEVIYGDTDSLYVACPAKVFAECDAEYVAGRLNKEEWSAAQVRVSMRVMN
jgi:DNA polymerase elongation subunit (family B)